MWRLNGLGCFSSLIPASSGVLLPLRLLHVWQHATRFSQLVSPARERGMTWSSVRGMSDLPQYWHRCPSRRRMFFRERTIFLYGTLTKTDRRRMLGNGIATETA